MLVNKQNESATQQILSKVRKSVNNLKNDQPAKRKQALFELQTYITSGDICEQQGQDLVQIVIKQLLACFSDKVDACREKSIMIIIILIQKYPLRSVLHFIISCLMDRVNCYDLEGVDTLPEKMRPAPGQKPKVLIKLIENCEEIRLLFCKLVKTILLVAEIDEIKRYLDQLVNVIRTLVIDPSPQIQKVACDLLVFFCNQHRNILLHYTQTLGRAVLLPLVSKKSKIRISALSALTAIFWCGLWKYNAFVFQNLIGFRDPNSVPIKDFYEPSHNINYFATLINDSNSLVRQKFMMEMKIWICDLDDKYDHHPKLVPYLLSGLFDQDQIVVSTALEIISNIGKLKK